MPAKVMVRRIDHTPGQLRELARKHRFRDRRRRMRAVAPGMEDGLSRTGVASGAGVGARTLRDRVVRYSADGLDGLRDAARPGAPPKLENGQAGEVVSWLDGGPDPDAGGPSRWTVADLRARIADSFGVGCALEGARQLVRRLGFRHMSPRPVHPKADPAAREGFGGDSVRLAREAVPDGVAPEDVPVYLQDGARVGRKGMLSKVRARKGTRPRVVRDHRYGHLYLFPPPPPPPRLPRDGRRGRACVRQGQHDRDGPAPPRHRGAGPRRKARPGGPRRGGPAPVGGPGDTGQRLPAPAAAHGPELNPGGTVFSVPSTGTSPTGCPQARNTSGRWSSTSGTPSSAGRGRSRGSPRGNGRCREIRGAYRRLFIWFGIIPVRSPWIGALRPFR